jgi:hypothetical protein
MLGEEKEDMEVVRLLDVPESYWCSKTGHYLTHPVVGADGKSYQDRTAWQTGTAGAGNLLNHNLKQILDDYRTGNHMIMEDEALLAVTEGNLAAFRGLNTSGRRGLPRRLIEKPILVGRRLCYLLGVAAEHGQVAMVQFLLAHGAKVTPDENADPSLSPLANAVGARVTSTTLWYDDKVARQRYDEILSIMFDQFKSEGGKPTCRLHSEVMEVMVHTSYEAGVSKLMSIGFTVSIDRAAPLAAAAKTTGMLSKLMLMGLKPTVQNYQMLISTMSNPEQWNHVWDAVPADSGIQSNAKIMRILFTQASIAFNHLAMKRLLEASDELRHNVANPRPDPNGPELWLIDDSGSFAAPLFGIIVSGRERGVQPGTEPYENVLKCVRVLSEAKHPATFTRPRSQLTALHYAWIEASYPPLNPQLVIAIVNLFPKRRKLLLTLSDRPYL